MKRKVVALLFMTFVALQIVGCSQKEVDEKSASVSVSSESTNTSVEETGEETLSEEDVIKQEQEQADAQIAADEIGKMHQKDSQSKESVEEADFGRVIPHLEGSDTWIRTESTVTEDGISRECYQCDEELQYQWESGQASAADIQEGLNAWMSQKNWELSESEKNDALSDALAGEVYAYEAMEDDNGYSMYHRGIYVLKDEYWYGIDFNVIEGVFGDYYDAIGEYLNKLTIS